MCDGVLYDCIVVVCCMCDGEGVVAMVVWGWCGGDGGGGVGVAMLPPLHVCIVNECMTICQKWKSLDNDVFEIIDANPELIFADEILDACAYKCIVVITLWFCAAGSLQIVNSLPAIPEV